MFPVHRADGSMSYNGYINSIKLRGPDWERLKKSIPQEIQDKYDIEMPRVPAVGDICLRSPWGEVTRCIAVDVYNRECYILRPKAKVRR